MRETGSPLTVTLPPLGLYTRVITLNSVVLRAPFGPMRATTSPASTVKETRSSATTPPKRTLSSRISSSAICAQVYCELGRLANPLLLRAGLAARRQRPEGLGEVAQSLARRHREAARQRAGGVGVRVPEAGDPVPEPAEAAVAVVAGESRPPRPMAWAQLTRERQARRRNRRSNPGGTRDAPLQRI